MVDLAGGNLAAGIGFLIAVAGILFLVELIEDGTTREAPEGDFTCDMGGCGTDFDDNFDIVAIQDAPDVVNGIYLFALGIMLAAGFVLVGAGVLSTFTGGGG